MRVDLELCMRLKCPYFFDATKTFDGKYDRTSYRCSVGLHTTYGLARWIGVALKEKNGDAVYYQSCNDVPKDCPYI